MPRAFTHRNLTKTQCMCWSSQHGPRVPGSLHSPQQSHERFCTRCTGLHTATKRIDRRLTGTRSGTSRVVFIASSVGNPSEKAGIKPIPRGLARSDQRARTRVRRSENAPIPRISRDGLRAAMPRQPCRCKGPQGLRRIQLNLPCTLLVPPKSITQNDTTARVVVAR